MQGSSGTLASDIGFHTVLQPSNTGISPMVDSTIIDVILVHGFTGSSKETWTHPETRFFWPQWLHCVKGLENIRVATFGYSSELALKHDGLNIGNFAKQLRGDLEEYCSVVLAPEFVDNSLEPNHIYSSRSGRLDCEKGISNSVNILTF